MTAKLVRTDAENGRKTAFGKIVRVSLLASVAATLANLVLYTVAGLIAPEVTAWPGAGMGQVVGATFAYLFIGTVVFAIIARLSPRPARHYLITASVGLLLSLALPIMAGFGYAAPGAPPASTLTVVTLSLMHVASFAISVPMFIRLVD